MGNIINPISIRLGQNRKWQSEWVSINNRKNNLYDDFFFDEFINWYNENNNFLKAFKVLFSHYYIVKINKKFEINLIYNIGNIEEVILKYISIYYRKKQRLYFKYKKKYSFLKKKQLLLTLFKKQVIKGDLSNWGTLEKASFYSVWKKNKTNNFASSFFKFRLGNNRYTLYWFMIYNFYSSKLLYYNLLSYITTIIKHQFYWYLSKVLSKNKLNFIKVNIKFLNLKNINSTIILKYLIIKLKNNYNLNSIIYPLFRRLKKNKNVLGIKIGCFGRFSRKQRATKTWYFYGKVPLNTLAVPVDYSMSKIFLKNSVCGLKVCLAYNFKYLNTLALKDIKHLNQKFKIYNLPLNISTYKESYITFYLNIFKKQILTNFKNIVS